MSRRFKILFLALLIVGLMAPSVFAGSIAYLGNGANNVPITVALEAMGVARNYTMPGSAVGAGANVGYYNAAIRITPGQTLPSGTLLTVTFTNAGFNGSGVNVCAVNSDVLAVTSPVASTTPGVNAASNTFVIGTSVANTQTLLLTTDGTNCNNSNGAFIIRYQPVSSNSMVSVSYTAALSGTTFDTGNATNIANIAKSFTTAYNAGSSTIDFATNSTSNGYHFAATSNAAANGNANIIVTPMNYGAVNGTLNAGLTVSAILSLQDTASWQGMRRVYAQGIGAGVCSVASNNAIAVNSAITGTVNLSIPANAFNGDATYAAAVCADVTGNSVLQSRTIRGSYDISVSTGGVDPAADTFSNVQVWTANGYQGIIPYISASSTYGTICFINNRSAASGPVTVDILTSESGATLTSLSGLSVGTLAAMGTMRVDFASSITPYTYSSATETAGTATSLTGLQANDRYSAQINVGVSPTQITVNCIQIDPAGSKRAVPVLTQTVTSYPWQQ